MNHKKMALVVVFVSILLPIVLMNVRPVLAITELRLDPVILYAEPGESIKINLTIQSAVDLYSWQANITFDPTVLSYVNVTEGSFLQRQPEGTVGQHRIEDTYILISWSTKGEYVGESGSGILAEIEFDVLTAGESLIELVTDLTHVIPDDPGTYTTFLYKQGSPNPPPDFEYVFPTDFAVRNSIFINTIEPPVASFTYSPDIPGINDLITFDASTSSATPPHQIVQYLWDFGDGDNATVDTPTVDHTFTEGGIFTVSLTVIDNATATALVQSLFNLSDTEMPPIWYELLSTAELDLDVAFQLDVAITAVSVSKQVVTVGDPVSINVTALNRGIETEDFDVTVFYGTTEIDTQPVVALNAKDDTTLTFDWDTTGIALGSYQIKAVASTIEGETNVDNNQYIDGTVTIEAAAESFPTTLIIGGAVGVGAAVVVIFLLLRRRSASSP